MRPLHHTAARLGPLAASFGLVAALLGLVAALLGLLVACGPGTATPTPPDPQTLLASTRAALAGATSYHLAGSLTGDEGDTLTVDITVVGVDATGTYADTADGNQSFTRLGGDIFVQGDQTYLEQVDPARAAQLAGQWLHASADDPRFLSVGTGFEQFIPLTDSPRTGASTTIDGAPAFTLLLGDGTLYVAATGKPYPLRVTTPGGTIDFTAYDQPVTITAPPDAVDI